MLIGVIGREAACFISSSLPVNHHPNRNSQKGVVVIFLGGGGGGMWQTRCLCVYGGWVLPIRSAMGNLLWS